MIYWSKIPSAVVQVLFGDVSGCYKNLRKGLEPITNSARIISLILGGTSGALITMLLLPHILNELITSLSGEPIKNIAVSISLNISDGSIGLMLGSRALDVLVSKMILPLYYYCKYGNARELYKYFTDKEIRLIHNKLAVQPGSSLQTMEELANSIKHEGYSPEQIKEIQDTILSGTGRLLKGIREQVIDYKEHVDDQEKINNHMSLLRLGKIPHLCLLNDSFVGSILMERFDLPKLNGRRSSGHLPPPYEEKAEHKGDIHVPIVEMQATDGATETQEPSEGKSMQFFPPVHEPPQDKDLNKVECLRLEF